jgi:hypothetical protein
MRTIDWDEMQLTSSRLLFAINPEPTSRDLIWQHPERREPAQVGIHRFDRHQQHDRNKSIHSQHMLHHGLTGLKINRPVDDQEVPSACFFKRNRRLLRLSATNRQTAIISPGSERPW